MMGWLSGRTLVEPATADAVAAAAAVAPTGDPEQQARPSQSIHPRILPHFSTYRIELCVAVADGRARFTAPCPREFANNYAAMVTRLEVTWFSCVEPGARVRLTLDNRRTQTTAVSAADGTTTTLCSYAFPTAPFSDAHRVLLFNEDESAKNFGAEARIGRWRDARAVFDQSTTKTADGGVFELKPGANPLRTMAPQYHTGGTGLPSPNSFTAEERDRVIERLDATVFGSRKVRLYPCDISGEVEVSFPASAAAASRPPTVEIRMLLQCDATVYL
jgi:hypothetical protein